jgi:hypothetical protein
MNMRGPVAETGGLLQPSTIETGAPRINATYGPTSASIRKRPNDRTAAKQREVAFADVSKCSIPDYDQVDAH